VRRVRELRNNLHYLVYCDMTSHCSCSVCVRQPPTLLGAASHVLFILVLDLERFELTADTTYQQYVFAVNSNRVDTLNLLPPEFPLLQLTYFHSDDDSLYRAHYHCPATPGNAPWLAHHLRLCETIYEAIRLLVRGRNRYWCSFCETPFDMPDCDERGLDDQDHFH
jgi:hypothetical protein